MEENVKKKKTILVVEDEPAIREVLVFNIKKEGYNTLEAGDGITGLNIAIELRPDLILLDIMLPKLDGLSVCKNIKNVYNVPILMLTAKNEEREKIVGLEIGADDYITKPFSVRELMARIKANLRKIETQFKVKEEIELENKNKVIIDELEIDLEKYEVKVRGRRIELTTKEYEVLKFLILQKGEIATREKLLECVWGYEYYGDKNTVDVTVSRIRTKIEKDTRRPKIILTKRGIGYYILPR